MISLASTLSATVASHHSPATLNLDTLVNDAVATKPLDKAILKKGPARLAYIREHCGVSAPLLSLSPREIAAEVQIVAARASTDDSILDEEIAGVQPEAELTSICPDTVEVPEVKDSSVLLDQNERRQLAKDLEAYRASCRARHLPSHLMTEARVLAAV